MEQVLLSTSIEGREDRQRWASTAWWINAAKGVAIAAVMVASAPLVAAFFEQPQLTSLVRIAALAPLLRQLRSTGLILRRKDLELGRIAAFEGVRSVAYLVGAAALCAWMGNAQAIVIAMVATEAIGLVASYGLAPMRPRFAIDRAVLRRVRRYTLSSLPVSVMTYVTTQVDDLAIGRIIGAEQLGYYTLAYGFALLPILLVSQLIERPLLPAFTESLATSREQGALMWRRIFELVGWVLGVLVIPLCFYHAEIISVFYGAKWAPAAPFLAVMLWLGLFRSWTSVSSSMLFALDEPEFNAKAKIVETILFLVVLSVLIGQIGAMAGAIAGLINYIVAFLARTLYVLRACACPIRVLWAMLAKLAATTALAAPIWWVTRDHGLWSLAACAAMIGRARRARRVCRARDHPRDPRAIDSSSQPEVTHARCSPAPPRPILESVSLIWMNRGASASRRSSASSRI